MSKCTKTQSGNHLMHAKVTSGRTERFFDETSTRLFGYKKYDYVEYYFLKCAACGFIDDSRELTISELDKITKNIKNLDKRKYE